MAGLETAKNLEVDKNISKEIKKIIPYTLPKKLEEKKEELPDFNKVDGLREASGARLLELKNEIDPNTLELSKDIVNTLKEMWVDISVVDLDLNNREPGKKDLLIEHKGLGVHRLISNVKGNQSLKINIVWIMPWDPAVFLSVEINEPTTYTESGSIIQQGGVNKLSFRIKKDEVIQTDMGKESRRSSLQFTH